MLAIHEVPSTADYGKLFFTTLKVTRLVKPGIASKNSTVAASSSIVPPFFQHSLTKPNFWVEVGICRYCPTNLAKQLNPVLQWLGYLDRHDGFDRLFLASIGQCP